MYTHHSQWNITPTYQLTKSNILDVFAPRELHRTHIEIKVKQMKKQQEKMLRKREVITYCHFDYLY